MRWWFTKQQNNEGDGATYFSWEILGNTESVCEITTPQLLHIIQKVSFSVRTIYNNCILMYIDIQQRYIFMFKVQMSIFVIQISKENLW